MMFKQFLVLVVLMVSINSNLTSEPHLPENVADSLRTVINKIHRNLENFGKGPASFSIIKVYLTQINKLVDTISGLHGVGHSEEEDHPFILCNTELSDINEDSKTIHADFLLTASTKGSIRNLIIGTYKIDLTKLDQLES